MQITRPVRPNQTSVGLGNFLVAQKSKRGKTRVYLSIYMRPATNLAQITPRPRPPKLQPPTPHKKNLGVGFGSALLSVASTAMHIPDIMHYSSGNDGNSTLHAGSFVIEYLVLP